MTYAQMQQCSRILRAETPKIRAKTTDLFPGMSGIDRQTLYYADRLGLKLLNQKNKCS